MKISRAMKAHLTDESLQVQQRYRIGRLLEVQRHEDEADNVLRIITMGRWLCRKTRL
jgi:hypothetical protein